MTQTAKMKNQIILTTIFSLLLCCVYGQIKFQKTYGIAGSFEGSSVQETNDGGYIIVSNVSVNINTSDIYLIKTNSYGDTLWTRTYKGTGEENIGYDVKQTTDLGFIIVGWTHSQSTGRDDVYLIKTNSTGNIQWSKIYTETTISTWGLSVIQTNTVGYLIAGMDWNGSMSNTNGRNCYLIQTDGNGNLIWDKLFGVAAVSNCVNKVNDGGYIFSGFIEKNSLSNSPWIGYLFKTDNNGTILWRKTYTGGKQNEIVSVQQTSDNGFIMTGFIQDSVTDFYDISLIKTNSIGDTLWTRTYGGAFDDFGISVQETSDSGFIITGYTNSFGAGDFDAYLIKTDSIGDTLWTKSYGGNSTDFGVKVNQTSDGGFVIIGYTKSLGEGQYHTYLIKTDANGYSGCNESNTNTIVKSTALIVANETSNVTSNTSVINPTTIVHIGGAENTICFIVGIAEVFETNLLEVLPNPTTGYFVINSSEVIDKGLVEVFNVLGEKIFNESIYLQSKIEINLENNVSGMYFIKVKTEKVELTKKIIVERN